jgi:hypothetical protein
VYAIDTETRVIGGWYGLQDKTELVLCSAQLSGEVNGKIGHEDEAVVRDWGILGMKKEEKGS